MLVFEGMRSSPVHFLTKRSAIWPNSMSVDDFKTLGWKPLPINDFVLKIHSRCNMACDYCYMYEMADSSWRDAAFKMSLNVVKQVAARIAEHVNRHAVETTFIHLHGGEPLLVGQHHLYDILSLLESELADLTTLKIIIQTNGLLLTDPILEILNGFDVGIGISLDGGQEANDKHRRRKNGVGTYSVVVEQIQKLKIGPYAQQYLGLLATVDITNPPIQVFKDLAALSPPTIDFLLPHGNWTNHPPNKNPHNDATPYADWLIEVFNYWINRSGNVPRIRMFDHIIRLLNQKPSTLESVGLAPLQVAIITPNGEYEHDDNLKSTYDRAASTGGLNVFDNPIDDVAVQPTAAARQIGVNALCQTCKNCSLHKVCGAGTYAHRYHENNGFLNPSVYCKDLKQLIKHIQRVIEPVYPLSK